MKLFFTFFVLLFSFKSFAGVGDTYYCEEKEINIAGYKAEVILSWNENSFTQKQKKDGTVDSSGTVDFLSHNLNYFMALKPYQDGHIFYSFDGVTYTNHFVKKEWTYISEYLCEKF